VGRAPGNAQVNLTQDWAESRAQGRNIYGDPDDCIQGVRNAQAHYDFDAISLTFNYGGLPHGEVLRAMRLFAREVMPAFRGVGVGG
jgi:hypothetical protein